jgi:hypothetical protein
MSMRQDQIERCDALWRELADTARVRWMPAVEWTDGGHAPCSYGLGVWEYEATDGDAAVPDFTDPATLGCLLAMLREASDDPRASVVWYSAARQWVADWKGCEVEAGCEPEALLLAIEEVSRAR